MSMSNIEYSALKKKAGLHNWGYMSLKDEQDTYDLSMDEFDDLDAPDMYSTPEVLHRNDLGEYYALQDFEE